MTIISQASSMFNYAALKGAIKALNYAAEALQQLLVEKPSPQSGDQSAPEAEFEGYSAEEWAQAVASVEASNTAVLKMRQQKGGVDALYSKALAVQRVALAHRDSMIKKDPRNPDIVGPLAGVSRVRACQVRKKFSLEPESEVVPGMDEAA